MDLRKKYALRPDTDPQCSACQGYRSTWAHLDLADALSQKWAQSKDGSWFCALTSCKKALKAQRVEDKKAKQRAQADVAADLATFQEGLDTPPGEIPTAEACLYAGTDDEKAARAYHADSEERCHSCSGHWRTWVCLDMQRQRREGKGLPGWGGTSHNDHDGWEELWYCGQPSCREALAEGSKRRTTVIKEAKEAVREAAKRKKALKKKQAGAKRKKAPSGGKSTKQKRRKGGK